MVLDLMQTVVISFHGSVVKAQVRDGLEHSNELSHSRVDVMDSFRVALSLQRFF